MEEEIISLRQENERLNLLVTLLVERTNQLQQQLNQLNRNDGGENKPVYSNQINADEVNKSLYSHQINADKINKPFYAHHINADEVNKPFYSHHINADEVNKSFYIHHINADGVNKSFNSNQNSLMGVNTDSGAIPALKNAGFTPDYMHVKNRLRPIMIKCNLQSVSNTAKMLIQMYVQHHNTHKSLRELTGLSEDGLTKRIMAMKKAGLIVRTAFQQYTLTEKARKIVEG